MPETTPSYTTRSCTARAGAAARTVQTRNFAAAKRPSAPLPIGSVRLNRPLSPAEVAAVNRLLSRTQQETRQHTSLLDEA